MIIRLMRAIAAGTFLGLSIVGVMHASAPAAAPIARGFFDIGKTGPVRVGLQVGHFQNDRLPEELARFRDQTGASAGGVTEAQANLAVAEAVKARLEPRGVAVDILPATVPERYSADLFLSIHADGSTDTRVSGYKIAPFGWDRTGDAAPLAKMIEEAYGPATGLPLDPKITRDMRGYYSFNSWRYRHAVSFDTPAAIIETGFLTNPGDRALITQKADLPAQAITDGIIRYLKGKGRLKGPEQA